MCETKELAGTKIGRLIQSMDRLSAVLERQALPVAGPALGSLVFEENFGALALGVLTPPSAPDVIRSQSAASPLPDASTFPKAHPC